MRVTVVVGRQRGLRLSGGGCAHWLITNWLRRGGRREAPGHPGHDLLHQDSTSKSFSSAVSWTGQASGFDEVFRFQRIRMAERLQFLQEWRGRRGSGVEGRVPAVLATETRRDSRMLNLAWRDRHKKMVFKLGGPPPD